MAVNARFTAATVIPTIRYNDAAAAIVWLCKAFGFEKHLVVPGEDGTIIHAQLVFGNGMVMLGSVRASEFGNLQKPPSALGGTDLLLTHSGTGPEEWSEVHAGWLSVRFPLKAWVAHGIDLRNHNPGRSWDQGYADQ